MTPVGKWVSAAAWNRIQIRGEQSIKDNTTNNYKKRDMEILQQIKVLLLYLVKVMCEGLWPDMMLQS